MLKTIIQASENFCIHQVREPYEIHNNIIKTRTLIAYIDIEASNNVMYRVYLAISPSFAQRISTLMIEEDESDENTLIDMTLETANLIVGSAKVLAEESGKNQFNISVPHFEKLDVFDFEYDYAKVVKIQKDEMIIAIKELN
ncbi:chemotaxis protein CheX [Candidatus Sulfurimonas marisnigri]|uniref:Chemotaxis protein CheX n=1 Tax=Candidatus Sulfurimonas marisnigri TaxID=2740405 RepID=A0A7S7LYD9_9BACT|nr:chemotaxis protein CheX [Candidatus Sulfurimonas marisnigri]QOY53662.1 chemotaxis protein CheX [Candidatus Sulfurimonas marisnigri]